jgi:hypothetical protein
MGGGREEKTEVGEELTCVGDNEGKDRERPGGEQSVSVPLRLSAVKTPVAKTGGRAGQTAAVPDVWSGQVRPCLQAENKTGICQARRLP